MHFKNLVYLNLNIICLLNVIHFNQLFIVQIKNIYIFTDFRLQDYKFNSI